MVVDAEVLIGVSQSLLLVRRILQQFTTTSSLSHDRRSNHSAQGRLGQPAASWNQRWTSTRTVQRVLYRWHVSSTRVWPSTVRLLEMEQRSIVCSKCPRWSERILTSVQILLVHRLHDELTTCHPRPPAFCLPITFIHWPVGLHGPGCRSYPPNPTDRQEPQCKIV